MTGKESVVRLNFGGKFTVKADSGTLRQLSSGLET